MHTSGYERSVKMIKTSVQKNCMCCIYWQITQNRHHHQHQHQQSIATMTSNTAFTRPQPHAKRSGTPCPSSSFNLPGQNISHSNQGVSSDVRFMLDRVRQTETNVKYQETLPHMNAPRLGVSSAVSSGPASWMQYEPDGDAIMQDRMHGG